MVIFLLLALQANIHSLGSRSAAVPPRAEVAPQAMQEDDRVTDGDLVDDMTADVRSWPSARQHKVHISLPAETRGGLGRTAENSIDLAPGHVLVDVRARRLYYALDRQTVKVYPVAVGKTGAQWHGTVSVGRMSTAPGWHPTAHERKRKRLPVYVAPGPHNPLGVRAIYLYRGGRDTMLRIHGTNQPSSIGHAVSFGCIRMRNADVTDLYSRVRIGTVVTAW